MSTKNTRLRFSDLFNGRIIYLAEPGQPVLNAKVGKKYRKHIPVYGISTYATVEKPKDVDGEIISATAFIKQFPTWSGDIDTDKVFWVAVHNYTFQSNNVYLDFLNTVNDKPVAVQDIYFNPNEARIRAFSKLKQAEAYAARQPKADGLESLFGGE